MAIGMANSDASSATVKDLVSFYIVVSDDTSGSSATTLVIHKEKFNAPLSSDEHKDLFNFVKHLKAFPGLAEIAKIKGLRENLEVMIAIWCSFIILGYKKLFLFARAFKK